MWNFRWSKNATESLPMVCDSSTVQLGDWLFSSIVLTVAGIACTEQYGVRRTSSSTVFIELCSLVSSPFIGAAVLPTSHHRRIIPIVTTSPPSHHPPDHNWLLSLLFHQHTIRQSYIYSSNIRIDISRRFSTIHTTLPLYRPLTAATWGVGRPSLKSTTPLDKSTTSPDNSPRYSPSHFTTISGNMTASELTTVPGTIRTATSWRRSGSRSTRRRFPVAP